MAKFRVVCGACILLCHTLTQARRESAKLNRGVIDELIDIKKGRSWRKYRINKREIKNEKPMC